MPPALTPIPWATLENAIRTFFRTASGLPDTSVIWGNQDGPRPIYPYGTVSFIAGPTVIGIDEVRLSMKAGPPVIPNPPINLEVGGQREATVSFQVFGLPSSLDPTQHARAYVSSAQAGLELPIYRDPLTAVGLAIFGLTAVSLPDMQVGDAWFSRAVLDVRFGFPSNVSQDIQAIETVHATAIGDDLGTLDPSLVIDQDFS